MTYLVIHLSDLLEETDPDGRGVPNRVLKPRPIPSLVNIHVVLKTSLQQRLEEGSNLPLMVVPKEIATMALGRGDGVGEEQVPKYVVPESICPRPDKDILRLRIRVASATTSPTELRPVEGPLEGLEIGLDLSSSERVV